MGVRQLPGEGLKVGNMVELKLRFFWKDNPEKSSSWKTKKAQANA
jgi:hypothetical protein